MAVTHSHLHTAGTLLRHSVKAVWEADSNRHGAAVNTSAGAGLLRLCKSQLADCDNSLPVGARCGQRREGKPVRLQDLVQPHVQFCGWLWLVVTGWLPAGVLDGAEAAVSAMEAATSHAACRALYRRSRVLALSVKSHHFSMVSVSQGLHSGAWWIFVAYR